MRADRLVAVLLLLQARGRVTAAEVADELEVSVRTARRDLEALTMAGVPIYPIRGRGGGWTLIGGARTDLTGLTADESQALLLAARLGGADLDAMGPALTAALRKLTMALPDTFRGGAERLAATVHVDQSRWGGPAPQPEPPFLEDIQAAVLDGHQIDLGYHTPGKEATVRRVHPWGLVTKASVWYLVAGTDRGRRTFRLSRVTSVDHTDEPIERPAEFDLGDAWKDIKADFGTKLGAEGTDRAVAVIDSWMLPVLRAVRTAEVEVLDELSPSRYRVEVSAPSVEILGYCFAGLGPGVSVEGPPRVRSWLAGVGRHLAETYGPAGPGEGGEAGVVSGPRTTPADLTAAR